MKKKEIKGIPFQKNIKIPEGYTYLAAVSLKKIEEQTLLIDIYKETKPVCRIVLTKSDYATYMTASDSWSTAKLATDYSYGTIWDNSTNESRVCDKTFITEADQKKIGKFTGREYGLWTTKITGFQEEIARKKETKREKNWEKALEERMKETPPHSVGFIAWAKTCIPENFLYYMRKGNYAYVTCSRCGQREKYYTGSVATFEQQFLKQIEIPRKGETARCLKCGTTGTYKCEGQTAWEYTRTQMVYDVQKWKETGVCISLIEVSKTYRIGFEEEYIFTDKAKFWYTPGRKTPICAYNHGSARNERWEKSPNDWGSAIKTGEYDIYPGYERCLKGTCLQYSGFEYYKARKKDIVKYMNTYLKNPELELLSKMKFEKIVDAMLSNNPPKLNTTGKSIADKLKIWPERVKQLQKKKGDTELWEAYRIERKTGAHFSEEFINSIIKIPSWRRSDFGTILRYSTPKKIENYTHKIGWEQIQTYKDYLTMRDEMGYDMTDSIILFPRDLRQQHDKLVLEKDKENREKRMEEKNKQFPEISKMYKKLEKQYGYKDDTFVIRPAMNAGEFVLESALLHHCVGTSDIYMTKHKDKKSFILFLRKTDTPDTAYCTVEMTPDGKICQWQQDHDRKPDAAVIEPWIQQYREYLKTKGIGA